MYQLIITHGAHTYSLFGDSTNIEDYPTIPVGAFVSIPAIGDIAYIYGPKKGFDLDGSEGQPDEEMPDNTSSAIGDAIIGEMNIGE